MANPKNLRPFKEGIDKRRNIASRPPGSKNRASLVKYWLEAEVTYYNSLTGIKEKMEIQDAITLALIRKALKGNVSAFKELMDSAYGKIADKMEMQTDFYREITIIPASKKNEV